MKYEESINFLDKYKISVNNWDLKALKVLLSNLNNPQDNIKIIHIAGTNGKGSVSSYISNILQNAGYNVGCFNSPYLTKVNESFLLNSKMISNDSFAHIVEKIKPALIETNKDGLIPTYFEVLVAMCFVYFNDKVDYLILEVGLGGLLDATNIINNSILSIITKISYDHINVLGNDLSSIAYQKAGIIKEYNKVVTYQQDDSAMRVIEEVCKDKNAELYKIDESKVKVIDISKQGTKFIYKDKKYTLKMIGKHQAYNASLAIEAINALELDISDVVIENGLITCNWKGRFECVCNNPLMFIDGAHNRDGIKALVSTIKEQNYQYLIGIIGVLADKDVDGMLQEIDGLFDHLIVTEPANERALNRDILFNKLKKYTSNLSKAESIVQAVKLSKIMANDIDNAMIVAFGSLYMIGRIVDN